MVGKGFQLFEERMIAKANSVKNGYKFDPISIALLIAALLPMILKCINPTPEALRKRLFHRSILAARIRADMQVTWREAFQLSDQCFDVAEEAKDQEVKAFIDDCLAKGQVNTDSN